MHATSYKNALSLKAYRVEMSFAETVYQEIRTQNYECLICIEPLNEKSHIWACNECFRAFHISCTQQWREKSIDKKDSWSCPQCSAKQGKETIKNKCWCGKVMNPKSSSILDPHSCGQTCGADRECPHPCPLICHIGPHADIKQCMFQGPKILCFCGKNESQTQCSMTKYQGFSCMEICEQANSVCGHKCTKPCHPMNPQSKDCGPCERVVIATCYCGIIDQAEIKCKDLPVELKRKLREKPNMNVVISCDSVCDEFYSCKIHKCKSKCHGHVESQCPFAPKPHETCFCGKMELHRKVCTDKFEQCTNVCDKLMSCGHKCQKICHSGKCPPCSVLVPGVSCRCRSQRMDLPCSIYKNDTIICDTVCKHMLDCHRHACYEVCCPYNKPKIVDVSRKKKSPSQPVRSDIAERLRRDLESLSPSFQEPEQHVCTRTCGRQLNCKRHVCVQKCHIGKCKPCNALLFDEWRCTCGRTIVEPPMPCSAKMPACIHRCSLPRACGHAPKHKCHDRSIRCPPCEVYTRVKCDCGKESIPTICSRSDLSISRKCKIKCEEVLACGHKCMKICCSGDGSCPPCTNLCIARFEGCSHPHLEDCHYPDPCPELCTYKLKAECPCGALEASYFCGEDLTIDCTSICCAEYYPTPIQVAYKTGKKEWLLRLEKTIRKFVNDKNTQSLRLPTTDNLHRLYQHLMLGHYQISSESIQEGRLRYVIGKKTTNTLMAKMTLEKTKFITPSSIDLTEMKIELKYNQEIQKLENAKKDKKIQKNSGIAIPESIRSQLKQPLRPKNLSLPIQSIQKIQDGEGISEKPDGDCENKPSTSLHERKSKTLTDPPVKFLREKKIKVHANVFKTLELDSD